VSTATPPPRSFSTPFFTHKNKKNIIFFNIFCQKSDRLRAPRAQFSWQPVGLLIFWVADPPGKNLDLATVYFSSVIFSNLTH
jgi:hypothetical protein